MFKLEFRTDNSAFEKDKALVIAGMLRQISMEVQRFEISIDIEVTAGLPIRDANGNTIGRWEYTPD